MDERIFIIRLERIEAEEKRGAPRGVASLFSDLAQVPGATNGDAWSEPARKLLIDHGYAHVADMAPSRFSPPEHY